MNDGAKSEVLKSNGGGGCAVGALGLLVMLGTVIVACEGGGGAAGVESGGVREPFEPSAASDVPLYDFDAAAAWYECPADFPAGTVEVVAFDQIHQYFGEVDRRQVVSEVQFPETTDWAQVGMLIRLDCPASGRCDHWDRSASVQLVQDPSAAEESWEFLELARHITPYRVPTCAYIDVTAVASRLVGAQMLASWIDTWVGPGHSNGEGWRSTVKFVFYPGGRAGADAVINVWGRQRIVVGETEPGSTIADQVQPQQVPIPAWARRVVAHLTTTGHSFGNTNNCAEFCRMRQDLSVNGRTYSVDPWRVDCGSNPVSAQLGTWRYARNGWCPGAVAVGHRIDITESIVAATDATVEFDIRLADGSPYVNSAPAELLPYELVSLSLHVYGEQ